MNELKNSMENISWEDSAPEEIPRRLCNPTINLPYLQESAKGVCLGPNESFPHQHTTSLKRISISSRKYQRLLQSLFLNSAN
jgi:hypothetical protein